MKKYQKCVSRLLAAVCISALFVTGFDVRAAESDNNQTTESADAGTTVPEAVTVPEGDVDAEAVQEEPAEEASLPAEEMQENLPEDGTTMPRAVAPLITKFNVTKLNGVREVSGSVEEIFNVSGQGGSGSYTINAKNTYSKSGKLTFTVRQTGTRGSVSVTASECTVTKGNMYNHVLGSDGGVAEFSQDYEITNISPDTSELHLQCVVNTSYSGGSARVMYRDIYIPIANSLPAVPESPEIVYDAQYPDAYVLTGTNAAMEYASFENPYRAAYEWKACSEEDMILDPGKAQMYYLVRYQATAESDASNYKQLILPKRVDAPSVSLDSKKEIITGLTTQMEYAVGSEAYEPVTEELAKGSIESIIDGITEDSVSMNIRYQASGKPAGFNRTFTLYKRLEAPKNVTLDPISLQLKGVVKGMEYMVDTTNVWYTIGNITSVNLDNMASDEREVTVKVRYPSSGKASSSKAVVLVLPQLKDAPEGLSINYKAETITGFDTAVKYQYRFTETGNYNPITLTNGAWNINTYINANSEKAVYIRKASTASSNVTASTKLIIPVRGSAPSNDVQFVYNDSSADATQAVIINTDDQMEYKLIGSSIWLPCTKEKMYVNIHHTSKIIYSFRKIATRDSFASVEINRTLKAYEAAPTVYFSIGLEYISNLNPAMEYRIGDGEFIDVGDLKTLPLAKIVDSLKKGETTVISVRYKRTADKPISKYTSFTVKSRQEPPKGVSYNVSTYTLSGVSTYMEYREKGTENWIKITSSKVDLKSFISNRPYNTQIEVRYAVTSGLFASYPITVNLYE